MQHIAEYKRWTYKKQIHQRWTSWIDQWKNSIICKNEACISTRYIYTNWAETQTKTTVNHQFIHYRVPSICISYLFICPIACICYQSQLLFLSENRITAAMHYPDFAWMLCLRNVDVGHFRCLEMRWLCLTELWRRRQQRGRILRTRCFLYTFPSHLWTKTGFDLLPSSEFGLLQQHIMPFPGTYAPSKCIHRQVSFASLGCRFTTEGN